MEKLYENRITENRKSKRGPKMTPNFSEIGPKGGETTVEKPQRELQIYLRISYRVMLLSNPIPLIGE